MKVTFDLAPSLDQGLHFFYVRAGKGEIILPFYPSSHTDMTTRYDQ